MSIDVPELADLEQVRARWRSAVAGVLAKSIRKDPADLGDQPEQLLDTPTYEGFAIRPLYTAFDELPEPPLPGEWPYVRGGDALRDVKSGWKVAEAFPGRPVPAAEDGNAAVLAALTDGVSALLLRVGESGVAPAQLERLLDGVLPEHGAGDPRCGRRLPGAPATRCWRWWPSGARPARHAVDRPGRRPADRGAERSCRRRRSRRSSRSPAVGRATAGCGRSPSTGRPSTIWAPTRRGSSPAASPPRWPTCGCSIESGMSVAEALRQISFRLAADDDQFMTIAKMRAAAPTVGAGRRGRSASRTAARPSCTRRRRCR